METITITTPFIRLDAFLKFSGLCMSGGEAKIIISDGHVTVNGEICLLRGKKLYPGDKISFTGKEFTIQ